MRADEICALPAGRELDALVAEKVMGLAWNQTGWSPWDAASGIMQDVILYDELPPYSTDAMTAWTVADEMEAADWNMSMSSEGGGVGGCVFYKYGDTPLMEAQAETIPLAICRAALLATQEGR